MTRDPGAPRRTCVGCRGVFAQEEMVRYVRHPDGRLLPDYRNKLPGRGAYACPTAACLTTALSRRQFDRAFRAPLVPVEADELLAEVRTQIHGRVLSLIGMARKSRQLLAGSQLVLDRLGKEPLELVILATDISDGVGRKVAGKAAALGVPVWQSENKESLGALVGRGESSVLALVPGGLAANIMKELRRYQQLSGVNG